MSKWNDFKNNQPWITTWWGDVFCLHLMPFIGLLIVLINPEFVSSRKVFAALPLTIILTIDWAHIFGQWFRIYGNPLETKKSKFLYLTLYVFIIFIIYFFVHYVSLIGVGIFLVYFVIFHFMKQQIGYMKIAGRGRRQDKKWKCIVEDVFLYGGIIVPVLYWHAHLINLRGKLFAWYAKLFNIANMEIYYNLSLIIYIISFCFYVKWEYDSYKESGQLNIAKNLSIFSSHIGWWVTALFPQYFFLVYFTVIWAHNWSYIFLIWSTGQRDSRLKDSKEKSFLHWTKPAGFFIYLLILIILGNFIMLNVKMLTNYPVFDIFSQKVIYPHMLGPSLNKFFLFLIETIKRWQIDPMVVQDIGISLFFGTQAHHYFIDRFLWKKEKDYAYYLGTQKTNPLATSSSSVEN